MKSDAITMRDFYTSWESSKLLMYPTARKIKKERNKTWQWVILFYCHLSTDERFLKNVKHSFIF